MRQLEPELALYRTHYEASLLLAYEFVYIVRKATAILLKVVHVVVHDAQFLSPLSQLPLRPLPVGFLTTTHVCS